MRHVRMCATLLMLLAGAAALPSAAAEPSFQPRGPGDVYLALGDSLVLGQEERANDDKQPGYPHVLYRYLRAMNPDLELNTDLARKGETSATMVTETSDTSSQLTRAREFIAGQRAKNRKVGLITLSVGMNDLIAFIRSTEDKVTALAAFKAKLEQICDGLLEAQRNRFGVLEGDLVLVALYNPYPGLAFPNKGAVADELVPEFNKVIAEVAQARGGLPVANVAAAFAGKEEAYIYVQRPYVNPNDILDPLLPAKLDYHPRPAGHRAIAISVMGAMSYRYMAHLPLVVR